jgi:magnesium transporter
MTSLTTFYLSNILGQRVYDLEGNSLGILTDLFVETGILNQDEPDGRPKIIGARMKMRNKLKLYSFDYFDIHKANDKVFVTCRNLVELPEEILIKGLFLADLILDKQIVDLNGRKLVRVNDVRLVRIPNGTFAIAVDVGLEGLVRRIGFVREIKALLSIFRVSMPSKFILWEDVSAIDFANLNIKLSKSFSKLHTLHPSDLADIIEELGRPSRTSVFSSLDEERAADVLEELETEAQIHIIESLPLDKAADVLEKMPANEAADLLDELEEDKAELLLREMEAESSQEVRELLEYEDDMVGSIMTTEIMYFNQNSTTEDVLSECRIKKPEADALYNLFVTNNRNELIATFSLRDLVVSPPKTTVKEIMKTDPIFLYDEQKVNEIAELISKYNLLAVPVVDKNQQLQGMVVIDDVIDDLVTEGRTNR